jgi:hypothetical protein
MLFLASIATSPCQTWFSLQEGDLRTGTDRTTVNTAGTLITTDYYTGGTYIKLNDPNANWNDSTNLIMGTVNAPTNYNRVLLSFDLSPITNLVAGQAFSVTAYLHLTMRELASPPPFGATFALHTILPFNETNATWNDPGSGMPAGGVVDDSHRLTTMSVTPGSYPTVTEWVGLNSTVANALLNPTNKTVSLLLKRNVEGQGDYNVHYVTDENTDPTYGGIDARPELQVGITILTNAPLVNVVANSDASEPATPGSFTLSRTVNITNDLTVNFTFGANAASGQAVEGVDFTASSSGSVTLPANVASTNIVITPIDNPDPNDTRRCVLNITGGGTNYGTANGSATVLIHDDNDGQALAQWFFGYDLSPTVWDTNITASAITTPTLFLPLETTVVITPPGSLWVQGFFTTNNEADTIALDKYFALSVSPKSGYAVTLTNLDLMSIYYNNADINVTNAVLFIRSSLDNYATTLASITNLVTDLGGGWQELNVPLGAPFSNLTSAVTFRFYVYDDGVDAGMRIDNLYIRGQTTALPPGPPVLTRLSISNNTVEISFTGAVSDTTSSFQLQTAATAAGPYADVASTLTQTGSGQFNASLPANGTQRFYRVRRTN